MAEQEKDQDSTLDPEARSYRVEGNDLSEYVGTAPEYQNYGSETEAPSFGEGAEAELQKQQQDTDDLNQYVVFPVELVSPAAHSHTNADPLNTVATTTDDIVDPGVKAVTVSNGNDGVSVLAAADDDEDDDEPAEDAPARTSYGEKPTPAVPAD